MDEMIDILNEYTGEKTGEVISKNEAHRKGIWHGSIHVIIVNNNNGSKNQNSGGFSKIKMF